MKIRNTLCCLLAVFVMHAVFAGVLYGALTAGAGENNTVSKYTLNGLEMDIRQYEINLSPGNFVGRTMFDAKKAGLNVYDDEETRNMAAIFAGKDELFDCVYTEDASENGVLYMVKEKADGVSLVVEIAVPGGHNEEKWYSDGIMAFSGSVWILSVQMEYSDGYSNFSNLYATKGTDRQAIIAHYLKMFSRDGWQIMMERKKEDSYICMALNGEKMYLLSVSHIKNGRYLINITG